MQASPQASAAVRPRRRLAAGAAALTLLLLGLQVLAVFRANVHGDEFALLHMADLSAVSGKLEAGGRPGLGVALLLPLVTDCTDEIAVVRRARLLWVGITVLWLAGVWIWLAQLAPGERTRWRDAGLGVALLVLPPAFLETSLQVRTDQLALAGGAWGGALLLLSARRPGLALAAGACFGIGLLGSQKVVYVAALAGLLGAGTQLLAGDLKPSRELLRAGALAAGAAAALAAFRLWAGLHFGGPEAAQTQRPIDAAFVAGGFSLFDFYRNTLGWREYRSLLPELTPHLALAGAIGVATLGALRSRAPDAGRLLLASGALALGLAVALFHAAAFRYFWLTLGLFPAAALALARRPLAERLPPRPGRFAAAGLAALLALPAGLQLVGQLNDSQAVQRESLAFVHRNFSADAAGFQPESSLFCQAGAQPLPTYFSQHIYRAFESPKRARNIDRLLARFRDVPVEFLVQSFRLNQFPPEVRRFWDENYQPYRASVFVAGRRLSGARGARNEFELLVPGRYRWLPLGGRQPVAIEGRVVAPGETLALARGRHEARFLEDVPRGLLLLALNEPPGEAPLAFYQP